MTTAHSAFLIVSTLALMGSAIFTCQTVASANNWQSECKIEVKDNYRYIDSNGIPNHTTGQFPNRGNPNSISPQSYHRRVPLHPVIAEGQPRGYDFGVAVNGVMFDPGTAELWNSDMRWHYEALTGAMAAHGSLGMDQNLAHVQPTGAYHYHGLPLGLLNKLDYRNKMVLVGWAADGFPIYGPFCYTNAKDSRSRLKELKSSYRLKSGSRPGGQNGPGGVYDGSFAQDYEYVPGLGDLDEFNGRTGVTPEFPGGTFYYVLTSTWPFIPRQFRGAPDSSFSKGPPSGRAGQHSHGPGRPDGAPGGGFGPQGGGNGFGPSGGGNGPRGGGNGFGPSGGGNGPRGGGNGFGPPGGGNGPRGGGNGFGPPGGGNGPQGGGNGFGPPGGGNGPQGGGDGFGPPGGSSP